MSEPLRFAILGMGGRGREAYGSWIRRHPARARIVAVADPIASRYADLDASVERFDDWRGLVGDIPRLGVDAVIVALPDRLHVEPIRALIGRGIPTLLEKPIAPTLADLRAVTEQDGAHTAPVIVGHVLRFTSFWRTIHHLVQAGTIGQIVTLEIRENIGFWHFAHSYVRGNWRSTEQSSPMVLAKTCHDLDLIRWLMGSAPTTVSSSGSLIHFVEENSPPGSPEFCIDGCPVSDSCPFYAPRYYMDALSDVHGVPVTLVTADTSVEGRRAALATSGYGRCVYKCDNDVADHQSTVLSFPGGATATLTASAFTPENTRHVTITGTAGQIAGHMDHGEIVVDLFSPTATLPDGLRGYDSSNDTRGPLNHPRFVLRAAPDDDDLGDHRGHAGGDDGLMEEFVGALERGEAGGSEAFTLGVALDSHYMAFAAEESRLTGRTIDFASWASTVREGSGA